MASEQETSYHDRLLKEKFYLLDHWDLDKRSKAKDMTPKRETPYYDAFAQNFHFPRPTDRSYNAESLDKMLYCSRMNNSKDNTPATREYCENWKGGILGLHWYVDHHCSQIMKIYSPHLQLDEINDKCKVLHQVIKYNETAK